MFFGARKLIVHFATFPMYVNSPCLLHCKTEIFLQLIYNVGTLKNRASVSYQIGLGLVLTVGRGTERNVSTYVTLLVQRYLPLQQHCSLLLKRRKKATNEAT